MFTENAIQYQPFDIDFHQIGENSGNPFFIVCRAEIIGPDNTESLVPGFYKGENTWTVRFCPDQPGIWTYRVILDDRFVQEGSVECAPFEHRDSILVGVSKANPTRFVYRKSGQPFFMNGYECDWLWALEMAHPGEDRVFLFLDKLKEHGFTTVLTNFFAYDCGWSAGRSCVDDYGPPLMIPWVGSIEGPDYNRLNLDYFDAFDSFMEQANRAGLQVHLYFRVYNKMVPWPANGSRGDDLYFQYLTARYMAFENIQWDFAKETYYETDKPYIARRLNELREIDIHDHLVTVHDDSNYVAEYSDTVDFLTVQQHYDFHSHCLLVQRETGLPCFNAEFGYEYGPQGPGDVSYGVGQSPEELLSRAYQVLFAGGYPAYYYTWTAWDVIRPEDTPTGYVYFRHLADFVNWSGWYEFECDDGLCLWRNAVAMRRGAERFLFLIERSIITPLRPEEFTGVWFDIFSGEKRPLEMTDCEFPFMNAQITHYRVPFDSGRGILLLERIR